MAFVKSGEDVQAITCDYCLQEKFVPELDDGEGEDEALEQAEESGWRALPVGTKGIMHCCPKCLKITSQSDDSPSAA